MQGINQSIAVIVLHDEIDANGVEEASEVAAETNLTSQDSTKRTYKILHTSIHPQIYLEELRLVGSLPFEMNEPIAERSEFSSLVAEQLKEYGVEISSRAISRAITSFTKSLRAVVSIIFKNVKKYSFRINEDGELLITLHLVGGRKFEFKMGMLYNDRYDYQSTFRVSVIRDEEMESAFKLSLSTK